MTINIIKSSTNIRRGRVVFAYFVSQRPNGRGRQLCVAVAGARHARPADEECVLLRPAEQGRDDDDHGHGHQHQQRRRWWGWLRQRTVARKLRVSSGWMEKIEVNSCAFPFPLIPSFSQVVIRLTTFPVSFLPTYVRILLFPYCPRRCLRPGQFSHPSPCLVFSPLALSIYLFICPLFCFIFPLEIEISQPTTTILSQ